MKVQRENEVLVKVGYRLPLRLTEALKDRAVAERRSINNQVIFLLEQALAEKAETK